MRRYITIDLDENCRPIGPHWIILLTDRSAEPGASVMVYGRTGSRDYACDGGEVCKDLVDAIIFPTRELAEIGVEICRDEHPRWLATVPRRSGFPKGKFARQPRGCTRRQPEELTMTQAAQSNLDLRPTSEVTS